MYTPRAFTETNLSRLDTLVAADPFVTLVTIDDDGAPCATHLPVLYRRDGEQVLIEGHWAKPNPQIAHQGPALVIVHGPHAYVSASWYPDKTSAGRVPTWNYAVAHLTGSLQAFDDEAALADIVSRLSDRFEASVGQSWRFEPERDDHRRQLHGITGFRFVSARIEMQFKLNQHHSAGNRAAVSAALESLDDPGSRRIADMMRSQDR